MSPSSSGRCHAFGTAVAKAGQLPFGLATDAAMAPAGFGRNVRRNKDFRSGPDKKRKSPKTGSFPGPAVNGPFAADQLRPNLRQSDMGVADLAQGSAHRDNDRF